MEVAPVAASRPTVKAVLWCVSVILITALLTTFREGLGSSHVALLYLLVVLGGSARGGRRLGLCLAILCFFTFNFFFIPPYHTLAIRNRVDWIVLLTFLVTSAVATQLLHRAQAEAETARRRALEIDRLASLGAEMLNVDRAENAAGAIASVIQSGLGIVAAEIYLTDSSTGKMRCVARASRGEEDVSSGTAPYPALVDGVAKRFGNGRPDDRSAGPPALDGLPPTGHLLKGEGRSHYIPLQIRGRSVGVLRLEDTAAISLEPAQQRFTDALSYYAALALERIRLTEAAEHADALRERDRLKDVLLASVSHDLRTPLTAIKALAHEVAAGGDERGVVVEEEVDRLNLYVTDLLELSRLNAEAGPVATELNVVEDVLGAALQQVSGLRNDVGVKASLDTREPLLVGRFDFVHTLRALVNLIENGMKYSPPDGLVEVAAYREGDRIVFSVSDRGAGIPSEDRERMFEPFFRGSRTGGIGGTGMGLAIAMRSAELQGGTLDYATRPGGGSVFSLRVSAAEVDELERMSL